MPTLLKMGFDEIISAAEPVEHIVSTQLRWRIGYDCLVGRPFVCSEIFDDFVFKWVGVDVDHQLCEVVVSGYCFSAEGTLEEVTGLVVFGVECQGMRYEKAGELLFYEFMKCLHLIKLNKSFLRECDFIWWCVNQDLINI